MEEQQLLHHLVQRPFHPRQGHAEGGVAAQRGAVLRRGGVVGGGGFHPVLPVSSLGSGGTGPAQGYHGAAADEPGLMWH